MPTDRNPENFEDKNPAKLRVIKKGSAYHCEVCNSEIPFKKPCPTCDKMPDWERVKGEAFQV